LEELQNGDGGFGTYTNLKVPNFLIKIIEWIFGLPTTFLFDYS